MRLQTPVQIGVILLGLCMTVSGRGPQPPSWQCRTKPVEPCVKHHGRLSSQNGIALKIWLIGTTRMAAVDNSIDDLPPLVRKYLDMTSPDHSYIFGDFDICPLEPDEPGHLRQVCVVGAEKLVVQDVQGVRPAFRLMSTWPAVGRKEGSESGQSGARARCVRTRRGARAPDPGAFGRPSVPFLWPRDAATGMITGGPVSGRSRLRDRRQPLRQLPGGG